MTADTAIIAFRNGSAPTTHLQIGSEVSEMNDEEILEIYNEGIIASYSRSANSSRRKSRSENRKSNSLLPAISGLRARMYFVAASTKSLWSLCSVDDQRPQEALGTLLERMESPHLETRGETLATSERAPEAAHNPLGRLVK